MIGMFEAWSRMVDASMAITATGIKMMETSKASSQVISARTDIIAAAVKSPLTGDYTELAKMIPEKVDAFSRAGSSVSNIWWDMSAAWMGQAQQLAGLAMKGRLPNAAEFAALQNRTAAHGLAMMDASVSMGTKSLAPLHSAAMKNAARLRTSVAGKKR